jgi:hypothetical protein
MESWPWGQHEVNIRQWGRGFRSWNKWEVRWEKAFHKIIYQILLCSCSNKSEICRKTPRCVRNSCSSGSLVFAMVYACCDNVWGMCRMCPKVRGIGVRRPLRYEAVRSRSKRFEVFRSSSWVFREFVGLCKCSDGVGGLMGICPCVFIQFLRAWSAVCTYQRRDRMICGSQQCSLRSM